jgi:coronin-7
MPNIGKDFSPFRNATAPPTSAANRTGWFEFNQSIVNNNSTSTNQVFTSKSGRIGVASAGNVLVFPGDKPGKVVPLQVPGGAIVTDCDWSPFFNCTEKYPLNLIDVLAVGTEDGCRVYSVQDAATPICSITTKSKRVESVSFNSVAQDVLATASGDCLEVWNIQQPDKPIFTFDAASPIQSMSWKADGSTIATTCKDGKLRLFTPGKTETNEVLAHEGSNGKPSRILFLSDEMLLTTGFSRVKQREWKLWDCRQASPEWKPLVSRQHNSNPGVLIPLFDEDAKLIFLAGRGDSAVTWHELKTNPPFITEQVTSQWQSTGSQAISIYGIALTSKFHVNTIQAEVDRLLILGNNLVPVMVQVPRRRYAEFPAELYPATKGLQAGCSAQEWIDGDKKVVALVSLDPVIRNSFVESIQLPVVQNAPEVALEKPSDKSLDKPSETMSEKPSEKIETQVLQEQPKEEAKPVLSAKAQSISSMFASNKQSPLRFATYNPHTIYSDLKGVSLTSPAECDVLQCSDEIIAFPVVGPGAKIGLLSIPSNLPVATKVGTPAIRLSPKLPCLLLGPGDVTDFAVDPFFKGTRIVTATNDGELKVWIVQKNIDADLSEPTFALAKQGRITIVQFHPFVQDLLLTVAVGSNSSTVSMWNLAGGLALLGSFSHPDYIMAIAFDKDGQNIISVAKDGHVRKLSKTGEVIGQAASHTGTKGARISILRPSSLIATFGFGKGNMREVNIYDGASLSAGILSSQNVNQSPSMMTMFWEECSGTLWLSGRGESSIFGYEVKQGPTIAPITRFDASAPQQGIWFDYNKTKLAVKDVEVVRAWRLSTGVEFISFKVPRQKPEYFQDDLYPLVWDAMPVDTAETWHSSASDLSEKLSRLSLCPTDMTPLSNASITTPTTSFNPLQQIAIDKTAQTFTIGMIGLARQLGDREEERNDENDKTNAVADDEWD